MRQLSFMFTFLAILLHSALCYGQQESITNFNRCTINKTDSGILIIEKQVVRCQQKINKTTFLSITTTFNAEEKVLLVEPQKIKESFIKIHGNVTYLFNYRSYIDTPFAETGVMQHTIQTRFDVDLLPSLVTIQFFKKPYK